MTRLPSIASRLGRATLAWSVLWSIALSFAVAIAVEREVDELLDDTLEASAELIAGVLTVQAFPPPRAVVPAGATVASADRFAWQVVRHRADGGATVEAASPRAPETPFAAAPVPGFSDTTDWRVFGRAFGVDGRLLYVAQTREERYEALYEVVSGGVLATLAVALLANLWLRSRVRAELAPLTGLARRLGNHDPLRPRATLGAAEREELAPMHAAIDALAARLARRIEHERAFTAHAAHALRTPLAGMDAQLAVALRECPPGLAPRLTRVRTAAGRLRGVVDALLALFRSGAELHRGPLDLSDLVARLPIEGPSIDVQATEPVDADADLVSAVLINLFDNAARHGARTIAVRTPRPNAVVVRDDGSGVDEVRLHALQRALDAGSPDQAGGLGLMLAHLVARAHGGRVTLAPRPGFAVEMTFGDA